VRLFDTAGVAAGRHPFDEATLAGAIHEPRVVLGQDPPQRLSPRMMAGSTLRWMRAYLHAVFEGGAESRRYVLLLVIAVMFALNSLVAYVLTGVQHPILLTLRMIMAALIFPWLVLRKRPTDAEWLALWVLMGVAWLSTQLLLGVGYAGATVANGVVVLAVIALAFDRWLTAWASVIVLLAYAAAQFHFHPAGRALAVTVLFAVGGGFLVLITRGTVEALRRSLREVDVLHGNMALAADRERARIAGELHDDTLQALTAAEMRLDSLARRLDRGETTGAGDAAREVREMVLGASDRTRRLSFALYPTELAQFGLGPAVDALVGQIWPEADVQMDVETSAVRYPHDIERLAYRTIRELLVNAGKHAQANRVAVVIEADNGRLCCQVRDDGRGFDSETWDRARRDLHMGLDATAERLRLAGGEFDIDSGRGKGTQVRFSLPLESGN